MAAGHGLEHRPPGRAPWGNGDPVEGRKADMSKPQDRPRPCNWCDGDGKCDRCEGRGWHARPCTECGGDGIQREKPDKDGAYSGDCRFCHGTGKQEMGEKCSQCNSSGTCERCNGTGK